jgi:hypothetical protein
MGLNEVINSSRQFMEPLKLPTWVIYSLPDALWVFSFTSFMFIIWNYEVNRQSISWIMIPLFCALFSEFAQALNILPGTFDITDIIFILIAVWITFIIHLKKMKISNHGKY